MDATEKALQAENILNGSEDKAERARKIAQDAQVGVIYFMCIIKYKYIYVLSMKYVYIRHMRKRLV